VKDDSEFREVPNRLNPPIVVGREKIVERETVKTKRKFSGAHIWKNGRGLSLGKAHRDGM